MEVPRTSDIVSLEETNNTEVPMGRKKINIETGCKHTHFKWEERLVLEYHYNGKNRCKKITSPKILGTLLIKNERTIRRELKRGMVEHTKSDLSTVIEYNAEYAQNNANSKHSAKGPQLKLGSDWELVEKVTRQIKDEHYSPYAVIQHFEKNGWPSDTRICEKTLYSYIQAGDLPDVSEEDLLYKGKRRKPKKEPKKHSRAMNAARSISKRPKEANERTECGHWEMDTVYSGKDCSPTCLLTLTERKTRAELIRKIPDRTAASVNSEIDKLEYELGAASFTRIFKSFTPDNGAEFSHADKLETSILTKEQRTQLYFAHPYCSFERGTNENHNGIIRRFIPKGRDIGIVEESRIKDIQNWMNNYPRKILGGKTPLEVLTDELRDDINIIKSLEVIL